jgi:Ca2+-binding RTX toxin-like protein
MKPLRIHWAAAVATLLAAGLIAPAQAEVVDGTAGPDTLVGTPLADTIRGFAGKDVLVGKRGGDHLDAGRGTDRVYGGAGADRVYGGRDGYQYPPRFQTDLLYGGPGPDRIVARFFDRVYAGRGNDTVVVLHSPPGSMDPDLPIRCGPGNDLVITAAGWPEWFFEPSGCERFKTYPHPD